MVWLRATRIRLVLIAGLTLSSGLAAGCQHQTKAGDGSSPVIAEVNGEPVRLDEFRGFTKRLADFLAEDAEGKVRSQLLDELIRERVTLQEARRQGLGATAEQVAARAADGSRSSVASPGGPAVPAAPELKSEDLLLKYQREVVLKDLTVRPEEVEAFYQQNRVRFQRRNGYYLRDIRVAERTQAEAIHRRLTGSHADFAQLAREQSLSPTAAQGGLRYYEGGQMPPVFEKVVRKLGPGQVSTVVPTEYGYMIFRLEGRAEPLTLEQAREQIKREMLSAKSQSLLAADMRRLLGAARVSIFPGELDFRYTGNFTRK